MGAPVGSVDIETEVIAWLNTKVPDGTVVRDEIDNNLTSELPTVQVERVGGDDDGFRLDRPLLEITVYAATRSDASALAAQIRGWLLTDLRGSKTANAVFSHVGTVSAPKWLPYEDTNVRKNSATYEMHAHPVS